MMGRYEIIVKTEEIRKRVQEGDFVSAQKIIDTMVLKKVKNIADLSLFAEVYLQNKNYDKAMDLLKRVYKKSRSRRTLNQMVLASIGNKNIEEAQRFLSEYEAVAPNDFNKYIFQYKIDKLKKEPYEVLIKSLKNLKKKIYIEKWAYELAKLYYKAGMEKECIRECSDIILWFGEGSYVEKAKILKAYYSGEVDKDEIINNLKNRASMANKMATTGEQVSYEKSAVIVKKEDNLKSNYDMGISEDQKEIQEEISVGQDYIQEETALIKEYGQEEIPTGHENEKESIPISHEDIQQETPGKQDDTKNVRLGIEDNSRDDGLENDKIEDGILYEISDSVRKEVENILLKEQDILKGREHIDKDKYSDTLNLIMGTSSNENLEELDRLSESLQVDIRQIFGNFLHIESFQKQLVKSLDLIVNPHIKSVQMIITGEPSSGKTTLAKNIAVFLNKTGRLKTSRIAKISALKLNEVDISKKKEILRHCCLVIENASELKKTTIDKILELIDSCKGDIGVILEENKKKMDSLFSEYPKLMELFINCIHLPQYTDEDLLGFAYSYIILRDYKLEPATCDVLNIGVNEIINNTSSEKRLEKIIGYVQNAINCADIRTGRKLQKHPLEGEFSDVEFLSLLPEDFTELIIA